MTKRQKTEKETAADAEKFREFVDKEFREHPEYQNMMDLHMEIRNHGKKKNRKNKK